VSQKKVKMNREQITKRCRWLRRNQTDSEKKLWGSIRNRKINNLKFLRQHPFIYQAINFKLYYFIADFYCAEKKIIIELDGKIHDEQKEYDENRDMILKEMNLKVVRFKNHELESAIEFVRGL
jgi:very-short-patch-repair endonuclease